MAPKKPELWPPYPGEDRKWPSKARTTKRTHEEYIEILRVLVESEGVIDHPGNASEVLRNRMDNPIPGEKMSTRLQKLDELGWTERLVDGRRTKVIMLVDIERTQAMLPPREAPEPDPEPEVVQPESDVGDRIEAALEEVRHGEPAQLIESMSEDDAATVAAFLLKRVLETKTVGDYSLQREHLETQLKKAKRENEMLREDLDAERRKASRLQSEVANQSETILALERNLHRALQAPARNGVSMEEIIGQQNFRELKRLMKEIPVSPASRNGDRSDH